MRDKYEIIAEILRAVSKRQNQTTYSLMRAAKTNWTVTRKYLDLCLSTGLLRKEGNRHKVTEKGKRYLETYKSIQALMKKGDNKSGYY